jgi:hypothetical protein
LPLFSTGCFRIVLGPLLPLYGHLIDYYRTIPSIAMAMLAGYGLLLAWRRGWVPAEAVAAPLLLYIIPSSWLSTGAGAAERSPH